MIDPPPGSARSSEPGSTTRRLRELFRRLSADTAQLLRQEIALLRAEISVAAKRAARDAAVLGAAGAVMGVGAIVLAAALVLGLGALLGNYWLAALIAGAVLAALGGGVSLRGLSLLSQANLVPERAIQELDATGRWAGDEVAGLVGTLTAGKRSGATVEAPRTVPNRPAAPPLPKAAPRRRRTNLRRGPGAVGLAKRVAAKIGADDVLGHAARLAYYGFLAMPPALMALFGAAGLIGSDRFADWLREQAALALPPAVNEGIIQPFIRDVVLTEAPGPFSIGLVLAIWGASSVFSSLMVALNITYGVRETRSWVKKRAIALATMLGAVILFLLSAVTLLAGPALADAAGLGATGELIWSVVQWPLAFLFMVAAFWTTYYVLPNRDQAGCKWVLIRAAAVAAVAWLIATAAFRVYIANFSSYTEAYGFLGGFIILLLWLYLTGIVVLTGGELAAEMEKES
ncbi:MAG: YihY family inner membrane protein [Gemmatimonadetes bacterium]|nr:YihY family inner membrane protein [Gemmatimonadota bacterium]